MSPIASLSTPSPVIICWTTRSLIMNWRILVKFVVAAWRSTTCVVGCHVTDMCGLYVHNWRRLFIIRQSKSTLTTTGHRPQSHHPAEFIDIRTESARGADCTHEDDATGDHPRQARPPSSVYWYNNENDVKTTSATQKLSPVTRR